MKNNNKNNKPTFRKYLFSPYYYEISVKYISREKYNHLEKTFIISKESWKLTIIMRVINIALSSLPFFYIALSVNCHAFNTVCLIVSWIFTKLMQAFIYYLLYRFTQFELYDIIDKYDTIA